ncbi:MAG: cell surface protein SprA [Ferruginibacter sp.]
MYYALYDSIKAVAQQYPNLNRFVLKGSARTSGSSDISIGYNIPRGSVSVTAGGQTLIEGADYDINYDLGTIKVTNQAILNAGLPVQVNFENNAAFGIQQRNYLGLRLDYLVKNTLKEQLAIGGTMVRLGERPFFTKNNIGEDPIRNTMYGLDVNYRKEMPRLTKLLDKLPFFSTTAPSIINAYAEGAFLQPGHAPQIGKGSAGTVYIDDFEGSKSGIDLRFPAISWGMASTPQNATDATNNILFPEATLNNNLDYGKQRAKLSWYQIEPALQSFRGVNNPLGDNRAELSDPRVRLVRQSEIFPQRTTDFGQNQLITFDLAYYPREKGPYNFETSAVEINNNNRFITPQEKWGGLMRNIDQSDFETANIEFIEFWMQDPFIKTPSRPDANLSTGGKLYFNLGNISEDVLKDGRRFYENGLPTPTAPSQVDNSSVWGKVPLNPIQVTNAFSNEATDRLFQDIGFDGLRDDSERVKRAPYLAQLQGAVNTAAFQAAAADPSADNYTNYRDAAFSPNDGILERYKNFNNPEGNSKVSDGSIFSSAATLYPDAEDLNRDNTMNESEAYFQYTVDIQPAGNAQMEIGVNYIVDKKIVIIGGLPDGSTPRPETWYQFRIPIAAGTKIGNIPDFKSIRFMRMYLTGFQEEVVMRFGTLELTRNIWRTFKNRIDSTGIYSPITTNADFNVNGVNIEENDRRTPLPYRTPREIQRQQVQSNNGVNLLQNEQSMSLRFCGLARGDARGVQQTFANRDVRQYGNLSMFIHAENNVKTPNNIRDRDLNAVIRIGTDFVSNYYEIKIPLYMTPIQGINLDANSDAYNDTLWRAINSLNVDLTLLPKLKQERNLNGIPTTIYRKAQGNGHTYSIMGDPNLGEIRGILIGVENANNISACGEIWVNELRLSSINEQGGWAAMARIDMTLADLGTVTGSMTKHTTGFGTLEQRVNERYRDDFTQFDVAANLELGKLLPKNAAISIPMFASYSQTVSMPEYDPFDLDIKLKDKLSLAPANKRDSIKSAAVDFTSTKTLNFTNVRKNRTSTKKPKVYDISNIDVSYSYLNITAHNPLIENNEVTRHRAGLGYNFAPEPKYIEPFKNLKFLKKRKTHWFDLLKDFNVNPVPSQISFRADINRQFGAIRPRSVGSDKYKIPETYDKYLTFQRDYIFRWAFTKSINFDFTATNNSRVDEPAGRIDTREKKDTVWTNLFRGGRNTLYNQAANISYTLPTAKFPLLDWTTINFKYQAVYRWIGASRLAAELGLGNILENGQSQETTAQLDFTRLYSKSKFFRAIDLPRDSTTRAKAKEYRKDSLFRSITKNGVTTKKFRRIKTTRIKDPNALPDVGTLLRVFGKLVTSVKQVNVSLSENANTRLPGYLDSTQFVGQNFRSMQPGYDFILGKQPDTNWLNNAARKGLFSKDTLFNSILQQSFDQRLTISAQVEPVRDLTISVNVNKTFNKNYSELFKDTTGSGNNFGHLSPYAGGGFDVSYISYKTLFGKFDPNRISATFLTFQDNRKIISQRLGTLNKYNAGRPLESDGYAYGYNKYAVDVLIPAFIAAYSGSDPNTVGLIKQNNPNIKSNPFRSIIPRPNWKLDYNGLSRIKGLEKIFTNVTLSHGYNGSLSMNGFTSALLYQDVSRYGYPSFYDPLSNNYIPYFLLPNITIQEQFAPLVGVDMMFTNQMQFKVDYTKQRMLSLSLVDFQLSETRSTEFSIGAGFRKRGLKLFGGLKLPKFLSKDQTGKLDNEINFRLDFRIRDNVTVNNRLDQNSTLPTGGSKEITITPTIDYFLNNRVNIKLYFDQRRVNPYISSSAPTTNTRAGLQLRISLAQ